jgi:hypothetical protein
MNLKSPTFAASFAAVALTLVGCGGSTSTTRNQTTGTVGSAGGTLTTGTSKLTIAAGALTDDRLITIREAEPRHAGRLVRIELEPKDLAFAKTAQLSLQIDDKNVKVKVLDDSTETEHLAEVEVEDRNHHLFKTGVDKLGEIEVELEHGAACTTACAATEECDDGVCKAHNENEHAQTCSAVCGAGQECDDGVCKAHIEKEPGQVPGTVACDPACATGLECDTTDGVCKPHGGTK